METTIGFVVEGSHPREWFIRLDKNLYDLKDAGLEWFEKPKESVEARGFSNHKWNQTYGIRKKWSHYFMLMTA